MLNKRKTYDVRSMNILGYLIKISKKIPSFFKFLAQLPPPSYICANFLDWVPNFIELYKREIEKYNYYV